MFLSTLVLAASLVPVQEPPPPVAPLPQEAPAAVSSADAPPAGAGQTSLDAGLVAFKKRRFSKAEVEFRKALDADPSSAAANFYLGYTYYKIAEPQRRNSPGKQKALEYFDKAFQLDPKFAPVWQSRK
jgi:tetratricopeptide (TPR) repeat protein